MAAPSIEALMRTNEDYEARITELEMQIDALSVHIPRMLSIMVTMQAQLEAQNAAHAQAKTSRRPSPRPPFTLDDGWLVA